MYVCKAGFDVETAIRSHMQIVWQDDKLFLASCNCRINSVMTKSLDKLAALSLHSAYLSHPVPKARDDELPYDGVVAVQGVAAAAVVIILPLRRQHVVHSVVQTSAQQHPSSQLCGVLSISQDLVCRPINTSARLGCAASF